MPAGPVSRMWLCYTRTGKDGGRRITKLKGFMKKTNPPSNTVGQNIIHNVEHGPAHDDERDMTLSIAHLPAG